MNIFNALVWRLLRAAIAMALASGAAWAANDPRWIWLAPLIQAIGKALREKFGITNIPI